MSGLGFTVPAWVCLGDSLTHEPPSSPTTILSPWPGRIDLAIYPGRGAVNHGHTGTQLATDNINGVSMLSHFNSDITGRGYYGGVLWGGINDFILTSNSGASVFADYQNIINLMLAEMTRVIAVLTHSPSTYSLWTPTKQTAYDAFATAWRAWRTSNANAALSFVDLHQAAPAGLQTPGDLTALNPAYAGVANDGLHYGQLAQDQVILPALLPLMQAPANLPFIVGGSSHPVMSMKTGDRAPSLRATLLNDSGDPISLLNSTVTFRMQSRYGGALKVNAAVEIIDAANGVVQHNWGATDTNTPGYYRAEFGISFEGYAETVPASGTMMIVISDPLS